MESEKSNRPIAIGIASIIAAMGLPCGFGLMVAYHVIKSSIGGDPFGQTPIALQIGYVSGFIVGAAMCVTPFVAIVLGGCSFRTVQGRVGLALGAFELLLMGVLALLGLYLQFTGKIPPVDR
jgi:hypothetical protein